MKDKKIRHMSKKLDIIRTFCGKYTASYSGRELARMIGVSPQTALTFLNSLSEEKVLTMNKSGRNSHYSLNLKNLNTKLYLVMAEADTSRIYLKNQELRFILEKLLPLSETIVVFGSFAKGTEKPDSDLDLIVIGVRNKKEFNDTLRIFPREINVHFVTFTEFAQSLRDKNHLAIEIKKDHLVYGNIYKIVEIYSQ